MSDGDVFDGYKTQSLTGIKHVALFLLYGCQNRATTSCLHLSIAIYRYAQQQILPEILHLATADFQSPADLIKCERVRVCARARVYVCAMLAYMHNNLHCVLSIHE